MHLQMSWDIKTCKLTDDSIEEIRGLPASKYNPFDRKGDKELYLEFAAIDENDPRDILKFINNHGFLGFKRDKERNHQEELKQVSDSREEENAYHKKLNELHENEKELLRKLAICSIKETVKNPFSAWDIINALRSDADEEDSNEVDKLIANDLPEDNTTQFDSLRRLIESRPPESEKLEDIKHEIIIMRCLVLLWQALKANHREGILAQMGNLYRLDHENCEEKFIAYMISLEKFNDNIVRFLAAKLFAHWVNQKLIGVNPLLSSSLTDDCCFTSSWYAPHLLSAMYVMFHTDLTGGVILRKCQSQTCNKFFSIYGNDERKVYCCEGCSSSQKQRDYRRRKKEQKLK